MCTKAAFSPDPRHHGAHGQSRSTNPSSPILLLLPPYHPRLLPRKQYVPLLRRLAGEVSAPLRRSLSTAASRPPWAMVYKKPALNASGATAPGRRASLGLNEAPCVSELSVPAHLAYPDAAGSVRAASCDGLLLLDFADTRQFPPAVRKLCNKSFLHEMATSEDGAELDVTRFVCNPLSGQLFRLPAPDTDAAKMGTPFGLLTQSPEGSHGPPDRYVVSQLSRREGDSSRVVRRYLSDTGEWDERQLFVPSTTPVWRANAMKIYINHEVLALSDRLWWVDLTLGACSVDPFSDRPEYRFVELPECSALSAAESGGLALAGGLMLSRYRRVASATGSCGTSNCVVDTSRSKSARFRSMWRAAAGHRITRSKSQKGRPIKSKPTLCGLLP